MADWQIGWPAIRWEENGWGGKRFRGLTGGNSPGTHGAASEKRCLPVPHSSGTWEEESGNILLKKFRPDGGRGLRLWGQCVLLRTRCRRSELNQHHPRVGGRRSGQEGGQGGWWVLYQDTTVVGSTTITQAFTQPIRQRWAENKLRRIIYDKWGNYLENTIFNFDLQTRKLGISAGSCPSVWFWAAWL